MKTSDFIFPFEDRVRQLPQDQGGSVLLLTGMMAFLVTILSLFALDTSQAIYNRVIAQNAVDGAAETGALWQARGLNMLQSLNNAHYIFNAGIYVAEWSALAACDQTIEDALADVAACPMTCWPPGPDCCEATTAATMAACTLCQTAGPLNDTHDNVASAILAWQNFISTTIPGLASVYASDVAHASGADALNTVRSQYPAITPLGPIPFAMPYAPYATTMYPTSTSLNNQEVKGDNWPWKWNQFGISEDIWKKAAEYSWDIGKATCEADVWPRIMQGYSPDFQDPQEWGWDDSYYQGVPGNMVWVAGKVNQNELAGLGFLRWLNGGSPPAEVQYSFMDQQNLAMYTGSGLTSQSLMIPAVLAVASSQAEGSKVEVVAKDTDDFLKQIEVWDMPPVDSAPKLTTVTFPGTTSSVSYLFIFH